AYAAPASRSRRRSSRQRSRARRSRAGKQKDRQQRLPSVASFAERRMHNLTVFGQAGTRDDFVFPVDRERFRLLVDQRGNEVQKILRIERGRIDRKLRRDIGVADEKNA